MEVMKWAAKYLGITAAFALLFQIPAGIGFMDSKLADMPGTLFGWMFGMFLITWLMFSLFGLTVFIPFAKKTFRYKKFQESVTIDKAPDVEHYIDYQAKFDMQKNDTFAFMTSKETQENDQVYFKDNLMMKVLRRVFK